MLTVPESYLRELEAEVRKARGSSEGITAVSGQKETPGAALARSSMIDDQSLVDCSAERFVQSLRELPFARELHESNLNERWKAGADNCTIRYTYSRLNFDFLRKFQ